MCWKTAKCGFGVLMITPSFGRAFVSQRSRSFGENSDELIIYKKGMFRF